MRNNLWGYNGVQYTPTAEAVNSGTQFNELWMAAIEMERSSAD